MNTSGSLITEAKQSNQKYNLRNYVNKIDKTINSAKWKQNLLLMYNYMPLTTIQDKIAAKLQKQQLNYKERCRNMEIQLNTQTIESDMESFKEFESKLLAKINQIEFMIHQQEMKIYLLELQVGDKRATLKQLIKENMELGRNMQFQLQAQRMAVISQIKKKTTMNNYDRSKTARKISSRLSTKYTASSRLSQHKDKYQQCLQATIRALRKMQGSQDVQQGIYLQIMNRKKPSTKGSYSLRSKICDTLIQKYGKLKSQQKNKEQQQFFIDWQTFKQLNWKQIMGIVLVRDTNVQNIRKLLEIR